VKLQKYLLVLATLAACGREPRKPSWLAHSADVTGEFRPKIANRIWANASDASEATATLIIKGDTAWFTERKQNYSFYGPWAVRRIVDTTDVARYKRYVDSLRAASGDTPVSYTPVPDTTDLFSILSPTANDSVIIAGDLYFGGERHTSIDPNAEKPQRDGCLYWWYPKREPDDSLPLNERIHVGTGECLTLLGSAF
jgi:hypothetical protein